MKKITHQEIQEIYNFIRQSVYELNRLTPNNDEIVIALPSWLIYLFQHSPIREYRGIDVFPERIMEYVFMGIKTQPHYTDEIVVFYKEFQYCRDTTTYKIHQIQFDND